MAGVVPEAASGGSDLYDDDDFERDLATLRHQPIDGLEQHVKAYVLQIDHPVFQVTFMQWYASLCRGYGRLFDGGIEKAGVFNAGWRKVRAWNHYAEDLLTYVEEHSSFDALNPDRLFALSNDCLKVFVLYDYLMCFDTGRERQERMDVPPFVRMFAILSALNNPLTYAAARSVALSGRTDGGDNA
jgi:hypothetical protein